jgi:hypothetical protein
MLTHWRPAVEHIIKVGVDVPEVVDRGLAPFW